MGKRDSQRTKGPRAGGIDPSAYSSSHSDRKVQRKIDQLCREARDALAMALATLDDPALAGAWIFEVLPGIDGAQLRVVVVTAPGADVDEGLLALKRASGLLRTELAAALARKRTPQLTFEVHGEGRP